MPSNDSYDPEVLIRDLDEIATENHVVDFLNSHFRELEDLEKLNSTLVELKENEQFLNEKVNRDRAVDLHKSYFIQFIDYGFNFITLAHSNANKNFESTSAST
jgi:hypothetical protein